MSQNTQKKDKGLVSKLKSLRKKKELKDPYEDKNITQDSHSVVKEKADSDYAKSVDSNGNNRNSMSSINRQSLAISPEIEKLFEEFKNEKEARQEAEKVKVDLERRNQTLVSELEACKQTIEKLQKDTSAQPAGDVEIDQLKTELQQKDITVQELNSQLAAIKDEFKKVKKEMSERIQGSPEEQNKEDSGPEDDRQEIINLKSELEQRDSTIQQLTSELKTAKKESEKATNEQEKNKATQSETEQLQLALNESKAENARLLAEINQKDNHIDQLTSDLKASQKEATLSKKVDQSEYENCRSALRSVSDENTTLKALLEENRNSLDLSVEENAHLTSNLEKTRSSLQLKTKELEKLTILVNNNKRSISKSADEIADLKDDLKTKVNTINELENDLKIRDNAIIELKAQLRSSKEEAKTAKKAVTDQQRFDQSTKVKLDNAITENEEMKKELQKAKSELESAQNALQRELEQSRSVSQELKDQLEIRDQTIRKQSETIELMVTKDHYDSVRSELESTKTVLNSVKSKLESTSTSDELREELSRVKAELKATREASEWEKSRNERTISELKNQNEILSHAKGLFRKVIFFI